MNINLPKLSTNRISHLFSLLLLISGLLLLSGCGSPGNSSSELHAKAMSQPVPPMQPATSVDFDSQVDIPVSAVDSQMDTPERTVDGQVDTPERVVIPSIGVDTTVVDLGWSEATDPTGRILNDWDVAAYAAGWHVNSNKLGEGGNVVMSGHNNILGAVFRELDQLDAGDVATVWSGDRRYDYEIKAVFIVPERDASNEQRLENAKWIGEFNDDRLTLVTCWPRDDNSHRVIAVGQLVDEAAGAQSTSDTTQ
jgi:LPXTG-site transpeptidase (sortase) family protein